MIYTAAKGKKPFRFLFLCNNSFRNIGDHYSLKGQESCYLIHFFCLFLSPTVSLLSICLVTTEPGNTLTKAVINRVARNGANAK